MALPPLIDVWVFGPERGCLMREIPIIHQLAQENFRFRLFVHSKHSPLTQKLLHNINADVVTYPSGLSLKYDDSYDIAIIPTLISLMRYVFSTSFRHYFFFRKAIRHERPQLIINDFLPFVPVYALLHGINIAGVYNYRLEYTYLGSSLFHRFLSRGIRYFFSILYALHHPMLIEQIVPKSSTVLTVEIPVIARSKTETKNSMREKIGLTGRRPVIYLSLGGGATNVNRHILDQFCGLIAQKGWHILIHPRNERESEWFAKTYPMFTLIPHGWLETQNVLQCSSLVIARAGFTTVAECIKLGVPMLLWHVEKHPEIRETENFLIDQNLCAGRIDLTSPIEDISKKIDAGINNKILKDRLNSIPSDGDLLAKTFLLKCLS